MAAEQAKDRGNRAFSAGNYSEAVASFSEAIALHARSGEGQAHVFYSNRSAAHLKLGDGARALADAEQCVALRRDWAKGFSRKGAALYHLGRYADAYRAYKDGLALEASNAALLDGLRSVEQRLAASASTGGPAGATPPPTTTRAGAGAKTLREYVAADKAATFQLFQFAMRCVLLLAFVLYWVPVAVPAHVAFAAFFQVALFNHGSYLVFTHGVPKWQAAYAQRLVLDPSTQALFFCLVFWVSSPYTLAMAPVLLIEMVHLSAYAAGLLQVLKLAHVAAAAGKALSPVAGALISDPSFAALPAQSKWAKLYHRMPQTAASLEVAIGLALVFEMLTPARNFLLTILYWQLLRVRYMINPQLQEAFRTLNAAILRLVQHPRCPAAVARVYAKIQGFATSMADVQQQQQAAAGGVGGLVSRCTVM